MSNMLNLLKNPVTLVTVLSTFVILAGLVALLLITGHNPAVFLSTLAPIGVMVSGILAIGAQQQKTIQQTNGNLTSVQNANQALSTQNKILTSALAIQKANNGTLPVPVTPAVVPESVQLTETDVQQLTADLVAAVRAAVLPVPPQAPAAPAQVPPRQ